MIKSQVINAASHAVLSSKDSHLISFAGSALLTQTEIDASLLSALQKTRYTPSPIVPTAAPPLVE